MNRLDKANNLAIFDYLHLELWFEVPRSLGDRPSSFFNIDLMRD